MFTSEKKLIAKREPELHCFITLCEEQAEETIRNLNEKTKGCNEEETVKRFPLFGMSLAVKDNLCIKGILTTCGSTMLEKYVPPYTATAVQRVMDAGAVVIGKTNMDEFAMGSSTENSAFGITKNPRNEAYVPGGSSGGSAAAVAVGMVQAALGTDTGGSVRQPAAFCGVVGLKPTYGKISRYGLVAYASSMDQIGTLTNNVADAAKLLAVMEGYDELDGSMLRTGEYPEGDKSAAVSCVGKREYVVGDKSEAEPCVGQYECVERVSADVEMRIPQISARIDAYNKAMNEGVAGLRIGLPRAWFGEGLSSEVRESVLAAADKLREAGAIVEEVDLPLTEYAVAAYYVLSSAQASSNLGRYQGVSYGARAGEELPLQEMFARTREHFLGKEVKRRILLGTFVLGNGYYEDYYLEAERVRGLICDSFADVLKQYDLLLGPTTPTTAWKLGEKLNDPMEMYLSDVYTVSANLTGLPAMSIPCGVGANNLPIGMQLMVASNREDLLFRVGAAWERISDKACDQPGRNESNA